MNRQHLNSQLLAVLSLGIVFGLTPLTSISGSDLVAYASEKNESSRKKDSHDEHGEEEEHEDHGGHGKEEKHDHAKEKVAAKDEHGHADHKEEKDEHGHGHDEGEEGHGDHEEEEGGARFGPGKAITAANKKDGIQLSERAVKTLGLGYMNVSGQGIFKLPFKSAVFFQDEVGVYRLKNGWHKLIEVELVSKTAAEVVVKTSEINSGDQIAKDGVPLLRAAELEAWGGSGDGHGH